MRNHLETLMRSSTIGLSVKQYGAFKLSNPCVFFLLAHHKTRHSGRLNHRRKLLFERETSRWHVRGQRCGVRATIRVRIRDCGRLGLRPIQGGKIHAAIKLPKLHVAREDRSLPFSAEFRVVRQRKKKLAMFVGQGATNEHKVARLLLALLA